ncbi:ImpA family type VI secretion system protein [Devosia nitrariae]|uniref:ImpA N-terminal domain-containing protein n=1 Tax=Devosia nitrariae TaxID=2071872 RepID=A0ABQ5WEL0_9HYPH|nr:type VI secretion system ImpA family N-terminal domain-containing protein [Devosia nitrariae]GLQ58036.1 hypothetical protein GCM10010862_52950 [Devosia nitrariae]
MRHQGLDQPLSEESPCGPDLDETGDWDYTNFMLLAGSQLPARFFSMDTEGTGRELPFDKSSIDLEAQLAAIDGFLARSHDIRLLTLEARFQVLTGHIDGFCEALQAIAALVESQWDHVHPLPFEGEHIMRQNTVEALEDQVQVILPLLYAPIVGSGNTALTYRQFMVANGKARPREGEQTVPLDAVASALSSERNREQAIAVHEAIGRGLAALETIRRTFLTHAGAESVPDFERLTATLADIGQLIAAHRSELAPAPLAAAATDEETSPEAGPASAPVPTGRIADHRTADAALAAAETYFLAREPSAPALVLVHQARMLIGKPLIAALDALMPQTSAGAMLRVRSGYALDIGIEQIRLVTDDVLANGLTNGLDAEAEGTGADPDAFTAATRAEAVALMLEIEGFFRKAEPSSPVPYLLAQARNYLDKDFASILNEMLPKDSASDY